jgi:hypothetical protein
MDIELKRLSEADPAEIIALMNDPFVRRQMPPATGGFSERAGAGCSPKTTMPISCWCCPQLLENRPAHLMRP